jgi:DNA-binding transcriptional LysR family regulator
MDLNRAVTFIRVVESGGFSSAASALGLPPSSVSRSVAKLEHELGVTLLERTTRKVSLTDAGRAYFERARDALAGLDEATALAHDAAREPHGVVRLGVPPAFAPLMAATVAEFLRSYPRIEVEVVASARAGDVVGDTVDLALVIGRQPDSSLVTRPLGKVEQRIFASPEYLATRGAPRTSAELAGHATIGLRGYPSGDSWELEGPDGAVTVPVRPWVRGDHVGFALEAAALGLGLALLPTLPARAYVARGALAVVLEDYAAVSIMQLIMPATRALPRRTALFRDHVIKLWSEQCQSVGGGLHGGPDGAAASCPSAARRPAGAAADPADATAPWCARATTTPNGGCGAA